MREFKFRVWDGSQMVYDITVGRFGAFYVNPGSKRNGLDEKDAASLTPFNTIYPEGTPVMQFTGLKDSEDVEIYEGDIIVFADDVHENKYPVVYKGDSGYPAFEIEGWEGEMNGLFYVMTECGGGLVVGNIYDKDGGQRERLERAIRKSVGMREHDLQKLMMDFGAGKITLDQIETGSNASRELFVQDLLKIAAGSEEGVE